MLDRFGRNINYLRISVTDKCNYRCLYCMPENGIKLLDRSELLTWEELSMVVKVAVDLGLDKVRLTGGEPLVRKGIVDFIAQISSLRIRDLSLTTNGAFLSDMAKPLKKAGLQRINISLDTLNKERFQYITRGGDIGDVLKGIEAAKEAGFKNIKLNTVLLRGINDKEIEALIGFASREGLELRFIEYMDTFNGKTVLIGAFISIESVKADILQRTKLLPLPGGDGPAQRFKLEDSGTVIGFISPISEPFCRKCNKLRLISRGSLYTCLLSPEEIDVRHIIRSGMGEEGLRQAFIQAINSKPETYSTFTEASNMAQIGG